MVDNIQAYGSKIVVKLFEKGDYSTHSSGLILPTNDKKRQIMKQQEKRTIDENYKLHMREGEILSVGNKVREFEVGDHIQFNIHNGEFIEINKERLFAIDEVDTCQLKIV